MRTQSVLGRPALALGNLAGGEPWAAAQALWDPEELAPDQVKTHVEALGLGEGFFGHFLNVVVDPLFLLGLFLSVRFPLPRVRDLAKFGPAVKKAAARSGWTMYLKSPWTVFADKPAVYASLDSAMMRRERFQDVTAPLLKGAFESFETQAGRAMTKEDGFIAWAHLEKLWKPRTVAKGVSMPGPVSRQALEAATTPAHRELVTGMRRAYDEMIEFVWSASDPQFKEEVISALTKKGLRAKGRKLTPEIKRALLTTKEGKALLSQFGADGGLVPMGGYLDDYAPHLMVREAESVDQAAAVMMANLKTNEPRVGKALSAGLESKGSPSAQVRKGMMIPSVEEMAQYEHLMDPERYAAWQRKALKLKEKGFVEYTMDLEDATRRYWNSMGSTYAWNYGGAGRKLQGARDELLETYKRAPRTAEGHNAAIRASYLENVLIPQTQGRMTLRQAQWSHLWGNFKVRAAGMLEPGSKLRTAMEAVPGGKETAEWLGERLIADRSAANFMLGGGGMTWLVYQGTLAANMGPSTLNAMQNIISGANVLGVPNMARGYSQMFKGGVKFFKAMAKGAKYDEAMRAGFPEFVEAGLADSPLVREAFEGAWRHAERFTPMHGVEKTANKITRAMMIPFQSTELSNRVSSFYGGFLGAMKEGAAREEALTLGRTVTNLTQFFAGPQTAPMAIANLPPAFRQYMQFPLKTLELALFSGPMMGTGAEGARTLLGRNLAVLGRMIAASSLTYNVGMEAFGADLSRGLLAGAMPAPMEGQPGYPLPFMPPLIGAGLGWMQTAYEGEWQPGLRTLPMFVPGGVAAARVAAYASRDVAEAMGKKYADWENPNPDGTFPIVSATTGNLVGNQSAAGLAMSMLGIPGSGQAQAESAATQWLLKNRDRLRHIKRDALEGLYTGDMGRYRRGEAEWKAMFPRSEGIPIRAQDLRALAVRRHVSRIERILDTLPPEVRMTYARFLLGSLFARQPEWLGLDPNLLVQYPTAHQRRRQGRGTSRQPMTRPGGEVPQVRTYEELTGTLPERRNLAPYSVAQMPFGSLNPVY